jgi:hypothetical protein
MPFGRVLRFRQFIGLVLLTVWLPVTQHCDFEAAGLFGGDCTNCVATAPCIDDDCGTIEAGLYRSGTIGLKVPAPALSSCDWQLKLYVLSAQDVEERSSTPRYLLERPRDWVPIWHVVRRAAPLSRAPSVLAA